MAEPDYKDLLGKLVADELKSQRQQDSNFDPRGSQGGQIDELTSSIVQNLMNEGQGAGKTGLEEAINANADMKYIVERLMQNPLIIPYVAAWLDERLEKMTEDLQELFKQTFPSAKPPDPSSPVGQ
ncbi:MAG: hypothetical protein AAF745_02715 [Planctomycetota bacterium]